MMSDPAPGVTPRQARTPSLEQLYREHRAFLCNLARRFGVEHDDIEDIVHEAYIVVRCKLETFDGTARHTTWLYSILNHLCHNYHRTRRRRLRKHTAFSDCQRGLERFIGDVNPDIYLLLEEFLDSLPAKQCQAFIHFRIEGRTGPEVSRLTGLKESTVRGRLFKADKKFRALYNDRDLRKRVYPLLYTKPRNNVFSFLTSPFDVILPLAKPRLGPLFHLTGQFSSGLVALGIVTISTTSAFALTNTGLRLLTPVQASSTTEVLEVDLLNYHASLSDEHRAKAEAHTEPWPTPPPGPNLSGSDKPKTKAPVKKGVTKTSQPKPQPSQPPEIKISGRSPRVEIVHNIDECEFRVGREAGPMLTCPSVISSRDYWGELLTECRTTNCSYLRDSVSCFEWPNDTKYCCSREYGSFEHYICAGPDGVFEESGLATLKNTIMGSLSTEQASD